MERVLFAPRELPPLRPDVSEDPRSYDAWVRAREQSRDGRRRPPTNHPALRLVLPVVGDVDGFRRTLRTLARQRDPGWSLTIAVGEHMARRCRRRVWSLGWRLARRTHIVTAPPEARPRDLLQLGMSGDGGSPVALVFPGDLWARDAVALLAEALFHHDVAYADEDRIEPGGLHVDPRLKPSYSPDFLMTSAYVGRPLAFRAHLLDGFVPVADEPGALEHECALYACSAGSSVGHVAEVLCHRTDRTAIDSKQSGYVEAALRRQGDPADVHDGRFAGTFHIVRRPPTRSAVTAIIPFRDQPQFLRKCVDSIGATAGDADLELVLVDNGSSDLETLSLVDRLSATDGVRILHDPRPFNWARLNNL
ncbi:MAG TPA: glycosyltransferase, partial [Acidimicrobiales bacterium]